MPHYRVDPSGPLRSGPERSASSVSSDRTDAPSGCSSEPFPTSFAASFAASFAPFAVSRCVAGTVRRGLAAVGTGMAPGGDDEVRRGQHEQNDRGPHVEPQAADVLQLHRVDPEVLDPAATQGVEHHVEREHPAVAEPEPPVGPEQHADRSEVPQRLVEERGMERRELLVAGGAVRDVDLEAPRQVGGPAEQLLVEVVAEAADDLREQQAGSQCVSEGPDQDAVAAAVEPRTHEPTHDRAPDPEAAMPDLQRADRISALAEVELVVGGDVPQPRTDQPCRDRPQGEVTDLPAGATASHPPTLPGPDGSEDAQDDREGVGPQRERPEVPDPLGGARDRQDGQEWGHCFAARILSRSSAMSAGEVPPVQTRSPAPWSTATTTVEWSTA